MAEDPVKAYLAKIGKKGGEVGGKRSLETLTDEERRDRARKAAEARWAKVAVKQTKTGATKKTAKKK